MADERRSEPPQPLPRGWSRHPKERMLITPLMAGVGGLLAFFSSSRIVVWLPIHTFDPPASADWAPLSNVALKGRNLFAQNGCYVCHSGYSRPQDVREALYFLYPKVSQPGDFYGSDQSPNLLGTERTGPDLSQESGWHPDDWQCAHFYDPRFVDPLLADARHEVALLEQAGRAQLISYVEQRSGKSGLLRYAGQLYAKHVVLVNQGFPPPYRGLPRRAQDDRWSRTRRPGAAEGPARGGAEPLPDRAQLLARGQPAARHGAEPPPRQGGLPPPLRRLSRPERRRQGPGRALPLADAGRLHRQGRRLLRRGHGARRLLLPDPARLVGDGDGELRRPPLGQRHLARRAVRQDDPERDARRRTACPSRGTTSSGSPRRSCWRGRKTHQKLANNVQLRQEAGERPVHAGGDARVPGLSPRATTWC